MRRLVAGALLCAAPTSVSAAGLEPTPPTEIAVQGPRRIDRGTLVSTVDPSQIQAFGTTSVGETLERLPAISAGGDSRGERILSLRGFDQRQIAVFVEGVPVYVPYDGQLDLGKLPIDLVARVTVVKGAGTLLYGPNGLGGAIGIVTREPTEGLSFRGATEVAPFRAARVDAAISASVGPVGGLVAGAFEHVLYWPMAASFVRTANEDGGRRNNSDRLITSFATKWTWDVAPSQRVVVSATRFGGVYGVPPATRDFTVRYWRWTEWSSSTVGLSHQFRGSGVQTEALLYVSAFSNTLDAYDDTRYATEVLPKAFHSIYDDTSLGFVLRGAGELGAGLTARAWVGAKRDVHVGIADRNADSIRVATNLVSAAGQVELERGVAHGAFALQADGELPEEPPLGARPRSAFGLGPLASLSLLPSETWTLTASAANRTRFPTLRERFSTVFGAREANPDLRPERAWNLSLDVVFRPSRALRLSAGVFDSELRDLVTSVIVRPQTDQLQNVGRGRLLGAELEVRATVRPWLEVWGGALVLRARAGKALDQQLAYKPTTRGLLALVVRPWPTVALSLVARHVGAQSFQNPDTGVWGELGAYQLFDARVDWTVHPTLRAFVRVNNVTDANVEARYSFPEAGRQVFVGLATKVGS